MKQRIWELDAARGLALIGMLVIHFLYDLIDLFGVIHWVEPGWYLFIKNNCGGIFLIISGICVTLGSRHVKRGIQVLCCGMVCTLVTAGMYLLGFADDSIVIYFGVLHCLGVCMLLWAWLQKLPTWLLAVLGLPMVAAGLVLQNIWLDVHWVLIPIGFCPPWFFSSDYFPLLPNLGYFLLGAAAGRVFYRDKSTRFPRVSDQRQPVRFLCGLGKCSLWVYLLHQPVLAGIAMLIQSIL